MADLEKDLSQLEGLLRRLEKEYEQFLAGQLRREPAETENAVQTLVRAYANRGIQNSTLAFKFNTLVARYNSFRTVWSRRLREREEGRSAGKAGAQARPAARHRESPAPAPGEYFAVDPLHEGQRIQKLFHSYRKLREEAGEETGRLRLESFQATLAEKVEKIKQTYGCEAVLIRVVKDKERTRIVAKPCRRRGEGAAGDAPPPAGGRA